MSTKGSTSRPRGRTAARVGFTERTYGMMGTGSMREVAKGIARSLGDASVSNIDSLESVLEDAWDFEDPFPFNQWWEE